MTLSLLRKAYGTGVIGVTALGVRRVPYLPRPRIEALRDARVRRLVEYAARHVPYYREMFSGSEISPRDIRGAEDLDRLPMLEKGFVRQNPLLFRSEARSARNALQFLSSGSTGRRLEFWYDRRSVLQNVAYGERERQPVNRIAGGSFRPSELYVSYETSTFKKVIAFYADNTIGVRPKRVFVPLSTSVEDVVEVMNERRPDILVGYGSWIDLFLKTVAKRGLEMHVPRAVMYIGEALPPGSRRFIEKHYQVPVLSRYNAVESFKIGYFCEEATGFHVHEDLCHLRIVAPDGSPCGRGEMGTLLMTNLMNRGSVLLNYPIGDRASWLGEECPCGRTFRVLSEIEGRVEDVIRLGDGRFVHPRELWALFKDDPDVLQYRLVQLELGAFSLELYTLNEAAFARAAPRAEDGLRSLLGQQSRIEIVSGESGAPRGTTKFRPVESRLDQRT